MKILTTTLLNLIAATIFAQPQAKTVGGDIVSQKQSKKVGDYIESFTNNKPTGMVPREQNYYPCDDLSIVSINGKNRYTRALYGSPTDYRVETSDMPIFALYKPKVYRNVRFYINDTPLHEVKDCRASYKDGMRCYVVKMRNGNDIITVTIDCVASEKIDGAFWHFKVDGNGGKPVTLSYRMCEIANPKLSRNGDIGADKAGSFDPSPEEKGLEMGGITFTDEVYAIATMTTPIEEKARPQHVMRLSLPQTQITKDYISAKEYFNVLSSRITFQTPYNWLNPLGGAISLAADGAWDGETWLHGAIGWRMPLAGWRAGYLGDVLGWNDRAISHFNAYANSQVTNVPPTIPAPSQDPAMNLARAEKKWGTQMYSNGYICRNPNRNNQMHHYDMNLNYMDELMWHFQYDADTVYMKKMWPVIKSHLAWEKRNFDPDNNYLYDAYCCIWASDALYYNGGEVTHSTAYNYRGNLLAAKIARIIGEDPTPYEAEAEGIRKAMNETLWTGTHWAEYKDVMGLKRVHPNAALWSIYTPIDCGVGTPEQNYSATRYVDRYIPHISVEMKQADQSSVGEHAEAARSVGNIISTSNWMPYSWSINNVASAEIMHTALAFFEAGRSKEAMNLVKANVFDQMYLGSSPANFGQISYYDAARGESYRDFGDNIGISSRTLLQGVFGIVPQALDGKVIIRPGFPLSWDSCEVKTPYLSYKYKREGQRATFHVVKHFRQPLKLVVRVNGNSGLYTDYEGTEADEQTMTIDIPQGSDHDVYAHTVPSVDEQTLRQMSQSNSVPHGVKKQLPLNIPFNANVTDIFRNKYLSPRPMTTSLEIPVQGIGEWCHPKFTVEIDDSLFRSKSINDEQRVGDILFRTPKEGQNILFASLWDNYPDSVAIPLQKCKKASGAAFLLAGSTNHMQAYMDNALIVAQYTDGTTDTLRLIPPYNYCPIEQDYYVDGKAFITIIPRPLRVSLSTGVVSADMGSALNIPSTEVYGREIKGGAAQVVYMPLNPRKKIGSFHLRCMSNDIVIGIMGVTLLQ